MGRLSKITAKQAVEIKRMLWNGGAQQDIALHFGVSQATISRIQRGEQWPHINWPDGSPGPLPVEREQQIIAQRFPGVAVRGIISNAMASGLTVEEIARRVAIEKEGDTDDISSIILEDTGERETVDMKERKIPLIDPKKWNAFKKLYPAVWWKDVPHDDQIKQSAVYHACTAEGADDIPGSVLRRQIDELEKKIRKQHRP